MATLEYTVTGQKITTTKTAELVKHTIGYYTVQFTFDSTWDAYSEKWAVFDPDFGEYRKQPLDDSGQCDFPGEVMNANRLNIGVYGVADGVQYPTIWTGGQWLKDGAYSDCPISTYPEPEPILEGMVSATKEQSFTDAQKEQARENIDALGKVEGTPGNITVIDNNQNISDSGISKDNLILAPQLASNNIKTDSIPYKYRQTGGGIGVGNREYDSIVGGSVVWNQLIKTATFTSTNTDTRAKPMLQVRLASSPYTQVVPSTDINSTGVFQRIFSSTFTGRAQILHSGASANQYYYNETDFILTNGHKYLLSMNFTGIDLSTVGGVTIKDMFCLDLTEMLGTAVADRLYAMETAQQGSGIALLKRMFPEDTYPYTAEPSLLSAMPTAHKMTDSDGNVIGNYPLAGIELRGVPAVDSDGNIYFDGDTYAPDGTVQRRYGIVDLGTLNWVYASSASDTRFYTTSIACNAPTSSAVTVKAVCALYATVPYNQVNGQTSNDMVMGAVKSGNTVYFAIKNLSYTSAAAFTAAMSGVYLIYELTTPTIETATPYESLQICDPLGTEEYVDERSVPVPVGHITKYPVDQVTKLDGLPSDFSTLIAPTEKTYTATRAYAVGRLLIVDNVLYKAQTAIASGATLTVGTNITATTLDEVIASL